jgi:predicted O-methyltransferase YrrM
MQSFHIDDAEFLLDTRPGAERGTSSGNRFILVKNQGCLNFYRNWAFEKPQTIMELGMFQGGSMVFLDKLFSPSRLVGLDIRREPITALEAYKQSRPHIKTYYACSQDGPGTLEAARENFPDGIDLVVDDASHKYPQTKAAFAMLFPLLRAGGKYVIEDWAWSHAPAAQKPDAVWAKDAALTNLVFELVVMAGSFGVVERLMVQKELLCIVKGRGKLPEAPFDLSGHLRGRELPLV